MFEHITPIELAGYGVGTFLLCATISAPKIDSLISTSQRRVDTKLWEEPQEFENKLGPELWGLVEHPAAVDKKLYWFSIHGNYLAGYDLVSKAWFRGRVHIHDRRDYFGDSDLRC
ncbi:hypothetical protein RHMOL_Rhmol10G0070000 [Rhododendron molle]|uniref:Uncharacterized protein n=1 Tax=Rhododendron molle TaxID=49168 RepID=A0ACC0LZZ5_RHOML|nr:hypothetical protein RHMOL_Rhmol10G0070000 [Rhododendron molle]